MYFSELIEQLRGKNYNQKIHIFKHNFIVTMHITTWIFVLYHDYFVLLIYIIMVTNDDNNKTTLISSSVILLVGKRNAVALVNKQVLYR